MGPFLATGGGSFGGSGRPWSDRPTGRCHTPEGRPQQAIDLLPRAFGRKTVLQLQLDEPNQERVEGAAGSQQLLRHIGERLAGLDHAGEGCDLASRPLRMAASGGAVAGHPGTVHGRTKTAPVMPEAA